MTERQHVLLESRLGSQITLRVAQPRFVLACKELQHLKPQCWCVAGIPTLATIRSKILGADDLRRLGLVCCRYHPQVGLVSAAAQYVGPNQDPCSSSQVEQYVHIVSQATNRIGLGGLTGWEAGFRRICLVRRRYRHNECRRDDHKSASTYDFRQHRVWASEKVKFLDSLENARITRTCGSPRGLT